jgi:hypothetical protein
MKKAYRPVPADEVFASFTPKERAEVKARAAELIAEEYALRDLRKARRVTQEQVARRLGGRQVYVSRLESRADMKLSTLQDYVRALGGDLRLVVTFPEGDSVRLGNIGSAPKSAGRRTAKKSRSTAGARRSA